MNTDLIPTNGVRITRAYSPSGYYVALYNHEGFTSHNRWFPRLDLAQAYALTLRRKAQ